MEVIALVGPSGTGKSHRALIVAHRYEADAIIDDGILIKDGKILAGKSAKHEKSRIMAVRRAIFILPGHAAEMQGAIKAAAPRRILIIATSDNMAHKIAKILHLPPVKRIVRIEDIASKAEMEKAAFYRLKQGKHIIPVPTIELKPHFSGYLIDSIQSVLRKSSHRRRLGEKSIVRPVFSYYGKLIIDDSAVRSIVAKLMKDREFVSSVSYIRVRRLKERGEERGIEVACELVLQYGSHIPTLIQEIQAEITKAIEYMTGLVVREVNIKVKALYVQA